LDTIVKLATRLRIPKPSGIMLLNIVALAMVAFFAVSNKLPHEHQAQIASAVRASDKLVKAIRANRDMPRDEQVAPADDPVRY
jgi:hypothetical protein